MSVLVRIDEEGRILIPEEIRKKLGFTRTLKLTIQGNKLVLEPVENPLKRLARAVQIDIEDVEEEIRSLRKLAEEELAQAVRERWR